MRIVHPFPSALDAAVVAAVAALAGASNARVAVLALSMLALQLAIGAANDWADAPADSVAQTTKPIPAGLFRRRTAALLAAALATTGLALAGIAGPAALAVGVVGLGTGLAYDLRLKGTRWSWLPYAVGIPLLPVFAWVGATGGLAPAFAVLVPIAVVAGAALSVANALADLERDRNAGLETVATALGPERARKVEAALMAAAAVAAVVSAAALGSGFPWIVLAVAGAALAIGGSAVAWSSAPAARQRAWELQAVGAAVLATGWIGGAAAAGLLG